MLLAKTFSAQRVRNDFIQAQSIPFGLPIVQAVHIYNFSPNILACFWLHNTPCNKLTEQYCSYFDSSVALQASQVEEQALSGAILIPESSIIHS